jgi:hypothetical protein
MKQNLATPVLEQEALALLFKNPHIKTLFEGLVQTNLPGWAIVAGCLFQTVWNGKTDRAPTSGIDDYDVFYFEDTDLSWDAEDVWIKKIDQVFEGFPERIELRNQARVHLWYPEKFDHAYPPLSSSFEGVTRFLHASAAIGLYADAAGAPRLFAPFGLEDMLSLTLRPNPWNKGAARRRMKEARWLTHWPELTVIKG